MHVFRRSISLSHVVCKTNSFHELKKRMVCDAASFSSPISMEINRSCYNNLTRQYFLGGEPQAIKTFVDGRFKTLRDFGNDTVNAAKYYWRNPLYSYLKFQTFNFSIVYRFPQFFTLRAISLKAPQLPLTVATFAFEVFRASRLAKAESAEGYFHLDASVLAAATAASSSLPHSSLIFSIGLDLFNRLRELFNSVWYHVSQISHFLWLLFIFTPVALSAPMALQLNWRRLEWMELFRRTLEAAGPAFIKWGQWSATRHDVFPPDFCSELEHLHSQAPAHKFRHTRRAIEESFGLPIKDLFDTFDETPVASGSIGQIHRASLSSRGAVMTGYAPGTVVAVKVRHPGVGDSILRDFDLMVWAASLFGRLPFLTHLRLEETLRQFAAPLREQVELSREAQNLRQFNRNFRKASHIRFPVPLYPLVHSDVLVESFEEGRHITEYLASPGNPHNVRLSELGSGTMLQMMLVDNLIHSDLHPGNILVRLDSPNGLLGWVCKGLEVVRDACEPSDPASPSSSSASSSSASDTAWSELPPSLDAVWLTNLAYDIRAQVLTPSLAARLDLLLQRWKQPSLVLLDVGMTTELTKRDQENMVGLFKAFAAMDGRACGEWTLRFSHEDQSCPNPEAFVAAMETTFAALKQGDLEGGSCYRRDELRKGEGEGKGKGKGKGEGQRKGQEQGQIEAQREINIHSESNSNSESGGKTKAFTNSAEALSSVLDHVREHKVSLPGHICAVVVTTLVLEGWSNKLDPDHSVLTQVQAMFEAENVPWIYRIQKATERLIRDGASVAMGG